MFRWLKRVLGFSNDWDEPIEWGACEDCQGGKCTFSEWAKCEKRITSKKLQHLM